MQAFAALLMSAVIAASVPAARNAVVPADAPAPGAAGEAYVAVLDADWNVTRETRVACPVDAGCAVDLTLGDAGLAAVHVRFDPPRSGAVAVRSRLEDRAGRASDAEDETLALDRTGFGAGHYEARMTASSAGGPVIMMAVRVPGWTAPAARAAPGTAERT